MPCPPRPEVGTSAFGSHGGGPVFKRARAKPLAAECLELLAPARIQTRRNVAGRLELLHYLVTVSRADADDDAFDHPVNVTR